MSIHCTNRFFSWITLACLALGAGLQLAASAAPAAADASLVDDLEILIDRKLISSAEYWQRHAVKGAFCDGALVAEFFAKAAPLLDPSAKSGQPVDILAAQRIFSTADYWKKSAVAGGKCDGGNVATVIHRIAGRVAAPPPFRLPEARLKLAPLKPVPAAQMAKQYDVVIAGAGTSGCGAAIQAARLGASVLLLEETDWIGGQMNAAAVTSMDEGTRFLRTSGLYRELVARIHGYYDPLGKSISTCYGSFDSVAVEPRIGQRILYQMLAEARGAGVLDVVLRARVAKVLKAGNTVTGVEIKAEGPGLPQTFSVRSRVLVDATEYGDILPLAGARYRVGNCTSDRLNPASLVQDFTWTAVIKQYPKGVPAALRFNGKPPGYDAKMDAFFARFIDNQGPDNHNQHGVASSFRYFIKYRGMPDSSRSDTPADPTRTHMNFGNDMPTVVGDLEDPARRWAHEKEMRLRTLHLLYFVQVVTGHKDWAVADDEGYDTPYNREQIDRWLKEQPELAPYRPMLLHFSVMVYTRESRRMVGKYTLTSTDIDRLHGPKRFLDTIVLGDYPADIHGTRKPSAYELDLDAAEHIPGEAKEQGRGPFPIPFASFIPETLDGFLPAEKNFSQSRVANGATRLQPSTLNIGQAVGAMAALAVKRNVQPRALNPVAVQCALLDADAVLVPGEVLGVRRDAPTWKAVQLMLTHNLVPAERNKFNPAAQVPTADFAAALKNLFPGQPLPSLPKSPAIPAAEAAKLLAQMMEPSRQ